MYAVVAEKRLNYSTRENSIAIRKQGKTVPKASETSNISLDL
jgi:hypothetical protein